MAFPSPSSGTVSAIIPARNEEANIEACVRSVAAEAEVGEILVINDQSSDRTAEIVGGLAKELPRVKLLETKELPAGWVGKNNAVWMGAKQASGEWLLFTDADAVHQKNAVEAALKLAARQQAAMVSYSPEQVLVHWYERALLPYVYGRLAQHFSYDRVNDPASPVAAANGQFLMIRRDAYEAVGGHASVAGDILEDLAIAERVKRAGYRIWFGSGKGLVRVRMYRTFGSMWEGWKKNLFRLMGGTPGAAYWEMLRAKAPVSALVLGTLLIGWFSRSFVAAGAAFGAGLILVLGFCAAELNRAGYPAKWAPYAIPGRLLFAAVLWASYRGHAKGKLAWKGREYPAGTPGASKV